MERTLQPSLDGKQHLTTERYRYEGSLTRTTAFATDPRRADRAIDATANDSLQIGPNVMSEERPPQATSAKRR